MLPINMELDTELYQSEPEDFIMVQLEHSDDLNDDLSDDSYDYCDDVYSIHSNSVQTTSSCSDAIGSVLTVPSILLKDLDEAHAAAELAIQDDLEELKTVESSPSVSKSTLEAESATGKKKTTKTACLATSADPAPLSRTSNKKRRKRLKLMKKAKAAANAAANAANAMSEKGSRAASSSTPKKKATKTKKSSPNGRSKRVHPHVVCATETLAAYREELRMTKQQSV